MKHTAKAREQERRAQSRLRVLHHYEQVTRKVSQTCRFFGISRTLFYRWRERYRQEGLVGLRGGPRGPRHHPFTTPAPGTPSSRRNLPDSDADRPSGPMPQPRSQDADASLRGLTRRDRGGPRPGDSPAHGAAPGLDRGGADGRALHLSGYVGPSRCEKLFSPRGTPLPR